MIVPLILVLASLSWGAVAALMAPSAWALFSHRARYNDLGRANVLLMAALFFSLHARRLAASEYPNDPALIGLLLASISVAGFTLQVARVYGRGRRV